MFLQNCLIILSRNVLMTKLDICTKSSNPINDQNVEFDISNLKFYNSKLFVRAYFVPNHFDHKHDASIIWYIHLKANLVKSCIYIWIFHHFVPGWPERAQADFTNVFWKAFALIDPKTANRQSSHQYLFALLVSAFVEAAHKMFVKSTLTIVLLFHNKW